MKATKKIVSTALASALIVSAGSTAFAAIPEQSFILGDNAYSNDFLLTDAGVSALSDIIDGFGNDVTGDVFFKLDESTVYDVENGAAVDASVLPEVTYYKADGTTTKYAAGDGDEIVATDMNITAATAINEGNFTVTFAEAPTTSLNGKTLTLTNGDVTATAAFVSLNGNVATFDIADTTNMTSGDYTVAASWTEVAAGVTVEFTADAALDMKATVNGEEVTEVVVNATGAQTPVDIELSLLDFGDNVEATIAYTSTWGQISEEETTQGQSSVVKLYPQEDSEIRVATITATVTSAKNVVTGEILEDLRNISKSMQITFKPAGSSVDDGKVYTINAGLADQADRVYVNLNQGLSAEAEELIIANPQFFEVTNNTANTPAQKVDVLEVKKKDSDTLVLVLDKNDAQFPLTDNVNHKVEMADNASKDGIFFTGSATFTLEDSENVRMLAVQTQKDDETLEYNQLKVVFSEAVNDQAGHAASVTNLNNWTINGLNLGRNLPSGAAANVTVEVVSTKTQTTERETAILTFKDVRDIQEFLVGAQHRLEVRNIGDWASITHTNNIVPTLSLVYAGIDEPTVNLDWTMDSPEQFVVDFGTYVTDGDASNFADTFEITIPDMTKTNPYDVANAKDVLTQANDDFKVTELESGRVFLIEMNKDWTKYYDLDTTTDNYHINKYNPLRLQAKNVLDAVGNPVKDSGSTATVKTAATNLTLTEDTTSPTVTKFEQLTKVKGEKEDVTIGNTAVADVEDAIGASDAGAVYISFSEPMQFADENGIAIQTPVATNAPASAAVTTPNQQQDPDNDGLADLAGTFEYVQLKDANGNDVMQNITVEGKITGTTVREGKDGEAANRDFAMIVEPTKTLADGTWKLVVRELSDDVGNTMATDSTTLTIETKDGGPVNTDLAVLAIDAHHQVVNDDNNTPFDYDGRDWMPEYAADADNTNDAADIIHIIFNENMDLVSDNSVLRKANYRLNGEALPNEGTNIVRGIVGEDGLETVKNAVTIILPDGTLDEKDEDHMITLINLKNADQDDMLNERLQIPYDSHSTDNDPVMHIYTLATVTTDSFQETLDEVQFETLKIGDGVGASTAGDGTTQFNLTRVADIFEQEALTIDGDLVIETTQTGTIEIGTNAGAGITITGDLTVNAPNATVINRATVNGTATITDVSNNTFENEGNIAKLVVDDAKTSVKNSGTIGEVVINSTVNDITFENDGTIGNITDNTSIDGGVKVTEGANAASVSYEKEVTGNNLVVTFTDDKSKLSNVEFSKNGAAFAAVVPVDSAYTVDLTGTTKVDMKYDVTSDKGTVTTVVYGVYGN